MKKLYIHAGFDKCGSSSIQSFLSRRNHFKCVNGDNLVYAALLHNRIAYGNELTKLAHNTHHGYRASVALTATHTSPDDYFNLIEKELLSLLRKNHVVLSREAWCNEFEDWSNIAFFRKHKIDITFIFYIRPPVNWMNSAWWQWGAWTDLDIDTWASQVANAVKYAHRIRSFKSLHWVNRVHVRLLDNNLLDDFSELVGIDRHAYMRLQSVANKSLSNGILRLYQVHRRLRPNPHSPAFDFLVEKYLNLSGKADWILNAEQIKKIVDETRDTNFLLLDYIDADCKAAFLADQRYWDSSAYLGMSAQPASGVKPTYAELEEITLASLDAIRSLANQQLKAKQTANSLYDNAAIWIELALHTEKSDIKLAYSLMKQAGKLRPEAPLVIKKLVAYEKKLAEEKQADVL